MANHASERWLLPYNAHARWGGRRGGRGYGARERCGTVIHGGSGEDAGTATLGPSPVVVLVSEGGRGMTKVEEQPPAPQKLLKLTYPDAARATTVAELLCPLLQIGEGGASHPDQLS